MNYIDKLKEILKDEGLRYTKQRQQVWDEIRSSSEHRDAEEIYIQINKTSKSGQRVLNVCGDETIHLGKVVQLIEAITGKIAKTQLTNEMANCIVGKNEKLKSVLGPTSFTKMETGLKLTCNQELNCPIN